MMMRSKEKRTLVVDFKTEGKEHSAQAEGFGGCCMVVASVLYVRDDGKGKKDNRKVVEKVWWGWDEQSE